MAKIQKMNWDVVSPAELMLLSGPEDAIARCAVDRVRAMLKQNNADTEVSRLDAQQYASGTLLSLASPSLFGEPRCIIVDNAEHMTDGFLTDLLEYAPNAQPDAFVFIRHRSGVRGKKALTAVRAQPGAVEVTCAALKRAGDRIDFIRRFAQYQHRVIDPRATALMAEIFADDIEALMSSLLQLFADVEGVIGVHEVNTYFGGRTETRAYQIAEAAVNGQPEAAVVLLRRALGEGAAPIQILASLTAQVRLLASVVGLDGSAASLAKRVGAAPWQIDRARTTARRWSQHQLRDAIELLARTDAALKGAGKNPEYRLETTALAIAQRNPQRALEQLIEVA